MIMTVLVHCVLLITFTGSLTMADPAGYGWDPVINPEPEGASHLNQTVLHWPKFLSPTAWAGQTGQNISKLASDFERDGFVVVRGIVGSAELEVYRSIHDSLMSGELKSPGRHDLGAHVSQKVNGVENVGQIMWPSDLAVNAREGPLHERGYAISTAIIGQESAFDFDMLIWKDPHTDTETPWHQDAAYWPEGMTDKRALTVWTALDDTDINNGAMWMINGSHQGPVFSHQPATEGAHILATASVSEATKGAMPIPLAAGDAVIWHGQMCHYSRGNSSPRRRRTFIVNFRPSAMVQYERQNGFDHLRKGFKDYDKQMQSAGKAYRSKTPQASITHGGQAPDSNDDELQPRQEQIRTEL